MFTYSYFKHWYTKYFRRTTRVRADERSVKYSVKSRKLKLKPDVRIEKNESWTRSQESLPKKIENPSCCRESKSKRIKFRGAIGVLSRKMQLYSVSLSNNENL